MTRVTVAFLLDGQTVCIHDYLEIKPENKERIAAQVQAGKLAIGPWYTLPDLFPIAGECLVRNLNKGIRFAKDLGGHQSNRLSHLWMGANRPISADVSKPRNRLCRRG